MFFSQVLQQSQQDSLRKHPSPRSAGRTECRAGSAGGGGAELSEFPERKVLFRQRDGAGFFTGGA